jgi:uncharacterized protein
MNSSPGAGALAKILAVLAAVVLTACLVAPPIYWGLTHWVPGTPLAWLADFPFYRYFSRTIQVTALLAVIPTLFWIGIWRPSELGLFPNPKRWPDLGTGFLAALLPACALGAVYLSLEIFRFRNDWNLSPIFKISLTACAVALVEEFLFRGILLGLAVRAWGAFRGVLFSSALFAIVHFLRPAKAATDTVTWSSGFAQIAAIAGDLPPWPVVLWGLATLFGAGILLAGATLRTKSLWLAIGLHAGWILGQQGLNAIAKFRVKPPDELLPWVGPSLVSGAVPTGLAPLLALGVATGATVIYLRVFRRAPSH